MYRAQRPLPRHDLSHLDIARSNMTVLRVALEQFRLHCGRFPTTREGLAALVHDPGEDGWQGPYIFELKPDPWMKPFLYSNENDQIFLSSSGPDGLPGSPDDIPAPPDSGDTSVSSGIYPASLKPKP